MIYLDHCATTPLDPQVYEAMVPFLTQEYGNPSSKYYGPAIRAREAVEQARQQVAHLIRADANEVIFTCGATESNNTIIKGISDYRKHYEHRGNHIITSKVEHHATLNTCHFLNGDIYSNRDDTFTLSGVPRKVDRGFEVTFLSVNEYGQVEPAILEQAIRSDTTIVSILWGNNELGSLNNIEVLGNISREHDVFFHSDATQVLGKLPIDAHNIPVDALSFSAHKLRGPKGIGALYVRTDEFDLMPPFSSLMHGGEQENGIRGGTLNVPCIVGFGKAAELAEKRLEKDLIKTQSLDIEIRNMLKKIPGVELLGDPKHHIPGIFCFVVKDPFFNNEQFLKRIGSKVAASAGSACTAGEPSHVLQAIGRGNQTGQVLRISTGVDSTVTDVQAMIKCLLSK